MAGLGCAPVEIWLRCVGGNSQLSGKAAVIGEWVMITRISATIGVSIAAISLAACASAPPPIAGGSPYAAAAYAGASQMGSEAILVGAVPPPQNSANGTPFELVAYEGIAGARRAHKLYTEAEAKELSGRCERYVKPLPGETPADIANLCNVSLEKLVAYNPDLSNVSYEPQTGIIEIPGGTIERNGLNSLIDQLADLYQVKEGDTLNKISADLGVPTAILVSLNPDVSWSSLATGHVLRKPSASVEIASAPASQSGSYIPESSEWNGYQGYGVGTYARSGVYGAADKLAPYRLGPVDYAQNREPADVIEGVSVNKPFVKAGDRVELTMRAPKGARSVTFYGGKTTDDRDMRELETVPVENGMAKAKVRVKKGKASPGGVIFKGEPDKGEAKYSDRIGVITVKPDKDDQ